jgi:hypothetical protein
MLPFTTYIIPESDKNKTVENKNWLWLVLSQPLSAENTDLLQKISAALKADFAKDVHSLEMVKDTQLSISEITNPEIRLMISFGVPPSALGLWIDLPGSGIRILESFTFIQTLSLEALATNANAKKDLWKAMQIFMDHS